MEKPSFLASLDRVASPLMADQSTGSWENGATVHRFERAIAAFFPAEAGRAAIRAVPGGFSGSPVARVEAAGEPWAVKLLPPSMDAARAGWLHRFMRHLRSGAIEAVPDLAERPGGGSMYRDDDGGLWEMLRWMPGSPRLQPTAAERAAAVDAVAAVHARAETFLETPAAVGLSPSRSERTTRCRQLAPDAWHQRLACEGTAEPKGTWPQIDPSAAARIRTALASAAECLASRGGPALHRAGALPQRPEPLVVVVRDLTADHLLFADSAGEKSGGPPVVSGLIDFHAARLDTPACDLGRLLASWHGGLPPPDAVREAVDGYCEKRASLGERTADPCMLWQSVEWIVTTAVVLGLDNWLRWVVEDRRQFPDWRAVATRIEQHLAVLPIAFERLANLSGLGSTS